jgi:tRNA-splicing ligase RtcB
MPVFKEIPASVTGHVPVKIWTDQVEQSAEQQLTALAGCPFIFHHVAAMPDVHYGLGATIGSVFATRDALLPTAVGVDIGCGLLAQPFNVRAVDLSQSFLRELHEQTKARIPTGFGQHEYPQEWEGFDDNTRYTAAVAPIVRQKGPVQLGSLGGGNHFLELCQDEAGMVWLMLHSGSRGAGNMIAQHHIAIAQELNARLGIPSARDLWVLPLVEQESQDYLRDMSWAQDYAMENRQRMLSTFVELFERLLKKKLRIDLEFDADAAINIHHNYANRETHYGEQVWVHRKGATFAGPGVLGIIPGSMATGSYIVRGLGNPESFSSCSHGAGRVMSRGEAVRSITLESFAHKMQGIVAETSKEYLDEAPQAYKDLDTVIHNQADLIEPVRRLRPLLNVKGAGTGGRGKRDGTRNRDEPPRQRRGDRTRDRDDPVQQRKLEQRKQR